MSISKQEITKIFSTKDFQTKSENHFIFALNNKLNEINTIIDIVTDEAIEKKINPFPILRDIYIPSLYSQRMLTTMVELFCNKGWDIIFSSDINNTEDKRFTRHKMSIMPRDGDNISFSESEKLKEQINILDSLVYSDARAAVNPDFMYFNSYYIDWVKAIYNEMAMHHLIKFPTIPDHVNIRSDQIIIASYKFEKLPELFIEFQQDRNKIQTYNSGTFTSSKFFDASRRKEVIEVDILVNYLNKLIVLDQTSKIEVTK